MSCHHLCHPVVEYSLSMKWVCELPLINSAINWNAYAVHNINHTYNHQQWWFWPHPNRFSIEQTSHAHNLLWYFHQWWLTSEHLWYIITYLTCYSKYTHSILHASTSYISISFFCPSLTFINLFVGRMSAKVLVSRIKVSEGNTP